MSRQYKVDREHIKQFMAAASFDPAMLDSTKARHKSRREQNLAHKPRM